MRYTGKLQKNGKIFDSNVGRAPFKFRLGTAMFMYDRLGNFIVSVTLSSFGFAGVGQVISGWDVGVKGSYQIKTPFLLLVLFFFF